MNLVSVDLEGLLFLVFSIPPDSFFLCSPLLRGSLSSGTRDMMEKFHFSLSVLTLCTMSVCGSLYLILSAARGSVSEVG